MEINHSDYKVYKYRLEGVNENTNLKEFYNVKPNTEFDVFGEVLVARDLFGNFREIITGMRMPSIDMVYDCVSGFYYTGYLVPRTPFRIRECEDSIVTDEYYHEYMQTHDYDEYKSELFEFRKTARNNKKLAKENNKAKSKRKVKRVS